MPYAMTIRSAPMRPAHRCTRAGGIGAAPCSTHSTLDRSRSSMPGRSAMRCNIVGVAVKVVTRCRSTASTARAGVEPLEHDQPVAGEQVVQRGERVDVVHRRHDQDHLGPGHGPPQLEHRGAEHLVVEPRQGADDDLGRARRPAAADAVHAGRDDVGQVGHLVGRGGRTHPRSSSPISTAAAITSRSRSSSQSGRSHRTGTGVAPSFQAAKAPMTISGELRSPRASRSPTPRPRAARAAASWPERRSSVRLVSTCSAPSTPTWVQRTSSGRASASWRRRRARLGWSVTRSLLCRPSRLVTPPCPSPGTWGRPRAYHAVGRGRRVRAPGRRGPRPSVRRPRGRPWGSPPSGRRRPRTSTRRGPAGSRRASRS